MDRGIEADQNWDGETWWKRVSQETKLQSNWDGTRQKTLACHDSSRQITKAGLRLSTATMKLANFPITDAPDEIVV